ncbi:MAG: hypothetical protein AAGC55_14225 [Myxococcota bacterium]
MPLRHQDFRQLCARCRAPTTRTCLRCALPLCAEHAPGRGRRCVNCEAEFRARILRREAESAERWQGRVRLPLLGAISVVALTVLWCKSAAKWTLMRLFSVHRRRFLAERKRAALPPGAP